MQVLVVFTGPRIFVRSACTGNVLFHYTHSKLLITWLYLLMLKRWPWLTECAWYLNVSNTTYTCACMCLWEDVGEVIAWGEGENVPQSIHRSDLILLAWGRWAVAVVCRWGQGVDHWALLAEADREDYHGQQKNKNDCHQHSHCDIEAEHLIRGILQLCLSVTVKWPSSNCIASWWACWKK